MSSLKDWYRYVDSKARQRPGGEAPADPKGEAEAAAHTPAAEAGADAPESGAAAPPDATVGDADLDIWSGLFPPRRTPEPLTGPLPRPNVSLDPAPADLPFAQTPPDPPPAPQFPLPDTGVEIPSFDEFVSPVSPEPPLTAAAAAPGAGEVDAVPEPAEARAASAAATSAGPTAGVASMPPEAAPGAVDATADGSSAAGSTPGTPPAASAAASGAGADGDTAVAAVEPVPGPGSLPEAGPPSSEEPATQRAGQGSSGPGRSLSPDFQPEPSSPLAAIAVAAAPAPPDRAPDPEHRAPGASRPLPGTPEWEKERVERLAQTFRETLRALEQSLTVPQPAAPLPAPASHRAPDLEAAIAEVITASPPATEAPAPAAATLAAEEVATAAAEPALPAADGPPPASAVSAPPPFISPEPAAPAVAPAPNLSPAVLQPAEASVVESRVEAPVAAPEAASAAAALEESPPPAVLTPVPARSTGEAGSVRQNIDEAALMRERLPQHIDMLLRIPTNEVAQNSYKSPFRESREELIRRLIDPQLTLEETARVLGVCPTTVRRYTNRGMLHCHRTPGNQRRFRMSDVLRFVEQYGDRIDRAAEARQLEEAA